MRHKRVTPGVVLLLLVGSLMACSGSNDQVYPAPESPSPSVKLDSRFTGKGYSSAEKDASCESMRDATRSTLDEDAIGVEFEDPDEIGSHCVLEHDFGSGSSPVQQVRVGVKFQEYGKSDFDKYVKAAENYLDVHEDSSKAEVQSECFIYLEIGSEDDKPLPGMYASSYEELSAGGDPYCGTEDPVGSASATFISHGTQVVVDIALAEAGGVEEEDLPFDPKRVGELREAMMKEMLSIAR